MRTVGREECGLNGMRMVRWSSEDRETVGSHRHCVTLQVVRILGVKPSGPLALKSNQSKVFPQVLNPWRPSTCYLYGERVIAQIGM